MKQSSFNMAAELSFYRDGEIFLASLQIRIMKQVVIDGSIHAAAKNLKMSYQHAWHLIDKLNRLSPLPVVIRQKGGKDGGGCVLSNYGLKLISTFDAKEFALKEFLANNNADFDTCFF
jgi:molybdate transport system regulatory protein